MEMLRPPAERPKAEFARVKLGVGEAGIGVMVGEGGGSRVSVGSSVRVLGTSGTVEDATNSGARVGSSAVMIGSAVSAVVAINPGEDTGSWVGVLIFRVRVGTERSVVVAFGEARCW